MRIVEQAKKVMGLIHLDPCAASEPKYHFALNNWVLGDGHDSLKDPWGEGVFVNPPFGTSYVRGSSAISQKEYKDLKMVGQLGGEWERRTIADWANKFFNETGERIWISKAAVEMAAIQRLMKSANVVHFPRRRVNYESPLTGKEVLGATFASMLLYFGPHTRLFMEVFNDGVNR